MYLSRNATCIIITNFPTSRCLDISTWSPPLAMCSGVLPSCLMFLLTILSGFYTLLPQSPLLPESCPGYLPVLPGLVVTLPLVGAAYRVPPTGLRFVPVLHWWGELGDPWLLGTTSVSCSTPLADDHFPLMTLSTPLLSSPCIFCPYSRPPGILTSPSYALVGFM